MQEKQEQKTALIVSADTGFLADMRTNICMQGFEIASARSSSEAFAIIDKDPPAIVFYDIENLPAQEMDLVNYAKTRSPSTEIVVLTGMKEIEEAGASLRNGASFYLIKPVECSQIKTVIEKLLARAERNSEHIILEQQMLTELMGDSPEMQKLLKLAIKIAPTMSTVLLAGESGTGKEFFARIIHRMSQKYEGRFVAANCGAIPDTLFESEMFGHRKGSFTGADRDKPGLVETAHMGTLFLDEVAELSPSAQVKLLRFLQERTFMRVGETFARRISTRIIAASNKSLPELVAKKEFREDLFYRLNVFVLNLPPLRYRKATIPNLVKLFIHKHNSLLGKNVNRLSMSAQAVLAAYDYPGNIRELENIIEHAVVLAEGNEISEKELPETMYRNRILLPAPGNEPASENGNEILTVAEVEKRHIATALKIMNFNYTETAAKLGISRSTLWRKIREYGLSSSTGAVLEEQ
jgi:DNA-binding NtrC family response regulator